MRKQVKVLSTIAGALLAAGMALNAGAADSGFVSAQYRSAEGTLTQVFADGSVLQTFKSGYVRAYPAGSAHVYIEDNIYMPITELQTSQGGAVLVENASGSAELIKPALHEVVVLPPGIG